MPSISPAILALSGAMALLLLICVLLIWSRRSRRLPYFSRKTLLSTGELVFYRALLRALPRGLAVAPKVRLADLIDCATEHRRAGYFARISQSHIDFVLIDADTSEFRLAIELDDRSHQTRRAQEKDEFKNQALAAAKIPLLRVVASNSYNPTELKSAILQEL